MKLTISYDGTNFFGWQVQPDLPTIQGTLETVLSTIEGRHVDVAGSGRTDAGVHAMAQIAACTLENPIPAANLRKALNRLLPGDIRILQVDEVGGDFHPRFQAVAKTYEYRIWREEVCPPFIRHYSHHFPYPLNEALFNSAALQFEGEHDFSAFAAADEKDALGGSKVRRIFSAQTARDGGMLMVRVRGSGFLKHMVRLMVGSMVEVGKENLALDELNRALTGEGGSVKRGPALPAKGLFLVSVEY